MSTHTNESEVTAVISKLVSSFSNSSSSNTTITSSTTPSTSTPKLKSNSVAEDEQILSSLSYSTAWLQTLTSFIAFTILPFSSSSSSQSSSQSQNELHSLLDNNGTLLSYAILCSIELGNTPTSYYLITKLLKIIEAFNIKSSSSSTTMAMTSKEFHPDLNFFKLLESFLVKECKRVKIARPLMLGDSKNLVVVLINVIYLISLIQFNSADADADASDSNLKSYSNDVISTSRRLKSKSTSLKSLFYLPPRKASTSHYQTVHVINTTLLYLSYFVTSQQSQSSLSISTCMDSDSKEIEITKNTPFLTSILFPPFSKAQSESDEPEIPPLLLKFETKSEISSVPFQIMSYIVANTESTGNVKDGMVGGGGGGGVLVDRVVLILKYSVLQTCFESFSSYDDDSDDDDGDNNYEINSTPSPTPSNSPSNSHSHSQARLNLNLPSLLALTNKLHVAIPPSNSIECMTPLILLLFDLMDSETITPSNTKNLLKARDVESLFFSRDFGSIGGGSAVLSGVEVVYNAIHNSDRPPVTASLASRNRNSNSNSSSREDAIKRLSTHFNQVVLGSFSQVLLAWIDNLEDVDDDEDDDEDELKNWACLSLKILNSSCMLPLVYLPEPTKKQQNDDDFDEALPFTYHANLLHSTLQSHTLLDGSINLACVRMGLDVLRSVLPEVGVVSVQKATSTSVVRGNSSKSVSFGNNVNRKTFPGQTPPPAYASLFRLFLSFLTLKNAIPLLNTLMLKPFELKVIDKYLQDMAVVGKGRSEGDYRLCFRILRGGDVTANSDVYRNDASNASDTASTDVGGFNDSRSIKTGLSAKGKKLFSMACGVNGVDSGFNIDDYNDSDFDDDFGDVVEDDEYDAIVGVNDSGAESDGTKSYNEDSLSDDFSDVNEDEEGEEEVQHPDAPPFKKTKVDANVPGLRYGDFENRIANFEGRTPVPTAAPAAPTTTANNGSSSSSTSGSGFNFSFGAPVAPVNNTGMDVPKFSFPVTLTQPKTKIDAGQNEFVFDVGQGDAESEEEGMSEEEEEEEKEDEEGDILDGSDGSEIDEDDEDDDDEVEVLEIDDDDEEEDEDDRSPQKKKIGGFEGFGAGPLPVIKQGAFKFDVGQGDDDSEEDAESGSNSDEDEDEDQEDDMEEEKEEEVKKDEGPIDLCGTDSEEREDLVSGEEEDESSGGEDDDDDDDDAIDKKLAREERKFKALENGEIFDESESEGSSDNDVSKWEDTDEDEDVDEGEERAEKDSGKNTMELDGSDDDSIEEVRTGGRNSKLNVDFDDKSDQELNDDDNSDNEMDENHDGTETPEVDEVPSTDVDVEDDVEVSFYGQRNANANDDDDTEDDDDDTVAVEYASGSDFLEDGDDGDEESTEEGDEAGKKSIPQTSEDDDEEDEESSDEEEEENESGTDEGESALKSQQEIVGSPASPLSEDDVDEENDDNETTARSLSDFEADLKHDDNGSTSSDDDDDNNDEEQVDEKSTDAGVGVGGDAISQVDIEAALNVLAGIEGRIEAEGVTDENVATADDGEKSEMGNTPTDDVITSPEIASEKPIDPSDDDMGDGGDEENEAGKKVTSDNNDVEAANAEEGGDEEFAASEGKTTINALKAGSEPEAESKIESSAPTSDDDAAEEDVDNDEARQSRRARWATRPSDPETALADVGGRIEDPPSPPADEIDANSGDVDDVDNASSMDTTEEMEEDDESEAASPSPFQIAAKSDDEEDVKMNEEEDGDEAEDKNKGPPASSSHSPDSSPDDDVVGGNDGDEQSDEDEKASSSDVETAGAMEEGGEEANTAPDDEDSVESGEKTEDVTAPDAATETLDSNMDAGEEEEECKDLHLSDGETASAEDEESTSVAEEEKKGSSADVETADVRDEVGEEEEIAVNDEETIALSEEVDTAPAEEHTAVESDEKAEDVTAPDAATTLDSKVDAEDEEEDNEDGETADAEKDKKSAPLAEEEEENITPSNAETAVDASNDIEVDEKRPTSDDEDDVSSLSASETASPSKKPVDPSNGDDDGNDDDDDNDAKDDEDGEVSPKTPARRSQRDKEGVSTAKKPAASAPPESEPPIEPAKQSTSSSSAASSSSSSSSSRRHHSHSHSQPPEHYNPSLPRHHTLYSLTHEHAARLDEVAAHTPPRSVSTSASTHTVPRKRGGGAAANAAAPTPRKSSRKPIATSKAAANIKTPKKGSSSSSTATPKPKSKPGAEIDDDNDDDDDDSGDESMQRAGPTKRKSASGNGSSSSSTKTPGAKKVRISDVAVEELLGGDGDGDVTNFRALKVSELKEECQKRGIDAKGLKAVLVQRLEEEGEEKNSAKKSPKKSPKQSPGQSPKKRKAKEITQNTEGLTEASPKREAGGRQTRAALKAATPIGGRRSRRVKNL